MRKFGHFAAAAVLAGLLGWSAWRFGLFYDDDAYSAELLVFAAVLAGLPWVVWGRKESLPAAALFPLGVAACYGITLLMGPASYSGTVDSMLRWTAFAGWLTLLSLWGKKPGHRGWGEAAIQAIGLFLLVGGWLGWFGWLSFPEIVLRFDDPELSATGVRLAGFLQYSNAYAAVLAFFLLRQWQGWAGAGKLRAIAASLSAIPYAGAIALTESRGAIAALLAGFVLALVFADGRRERGKLLLVACWTLLGGCAAAGGALRAVAAGGSWGWLTAGVLVAGAGALYGLWLWTSRRGKGEGWPTVILWAGVTVLALALGAAAYAWMGSMGNGSRLSGGEFGTAASRLLFYRDGWRMFLDSPWLGFGGDSWRSLFGYYQSQPYVGSEVHSGYLDMLLDTGLLGLAALAVMLVVWIRRVWKTRREALAPAAVLLLHAAVDFDFSYAWIWLLLLAWFALFSANAEAGRPDARRWRAAGGVAAALLLGASAWGLWAAWHGHAAARDLAAARRTATPAAREAKLRAALTANPALVRIRLALAPILLQAEERESVLAAGLRYEPQSAPLLLQLGLAEAELGIAAQAEVRLREALRLERFSREAHVAAIAEMARLSQALRFRGDAAGARTAAEAAVSFYERFAALAREVEAEPHPANGRGFAMAPSAQFNAAQAYADLGRIPKARGLLLGLISADSDGWRDEAEELLKKLDEGSASERVAESPG
ncbi:O-antigen ligase family protein [Cohnella candidum]|uniref:O-antigen ligase family protein n=1 Tax=Cohnella candidum TaxID=2674991 RepID=UPI0013DDA8CF|nr:O-antigen ligase family protein [Cohnella candidum]